MKKIPLEYILSISFIAAVEREQLLMKKYDGYMKDISKSEAAGIIKEFKKNAQEHVSLLKDKMVKLNIQGQVNK